MSQKSERKIVQIGSQYRPFRYERRTPMEYECLRPVIEGDALRLQSALLIERRSMKEIANRVLAMSISLSALAAGCAAMVGWI